jgi:hypothetical protein
MAPYIPGVWWPHPPLLSIETELPLGGTTDLWKLTEEQRYTFDTQGYMVIHGALNRSALDRLLSTWPELGDDVLRDVDFRWGPEWAELIDLVSVCEVIPGFLGGTLRLDHAFVIQAGFIASHGRMHHESGRFHEGVLYSVSKGRIYTSYLAVSFALTDIPPGYGGFCCIPGSHKSDFDTPASLYDVANNPLVRQVPQQAGDALVFTEALTHGTFPPITGFRRQSVVLKYTPGSVTYLRPADSPHVRRLPPSPNFPADPDGGSWEIDQLTDRQRAIIAEPAYARFRPQFGSQHEDETP